MIVFLVVLFFLVVIGVGIYDIVQRKHAILRNFPIIGHFRYLLESIGPELRQYIVTDNDQERPFSRDQRRWVYASAKKQNSYFGFGTDNAIESSPDYLIIKQSAFPLADLHAGDPGYDPLFPLACSKIVGEARQRKKAFRPASVVNVAAMSFGSLGSAATESINRGCQLANCLHNTGEGGVADHHRHGGELVWQIGTGYFGCRDAQGNFDLAKLVATVEATPTIKAIEVKLSQGAKPGLGGVLPAAKITDEISQVRGIPKGKDCLSPSHHKAFHDVDSLLDFVESLASATGLPIGIKSAVGDQGFWKDLADSMAKDSSRGVDFICIDGGEGGTGAAPLSFSDHVSLPFRTGFPRVYLEFAKRNLQDRIVFIGSGRLGFPEAGILSMVLGCDLIAVAREAMLAIGCIQAQRCHLGHCPAGIATHHPWLMRGLDPTLKAARLANYMAALRKEMTRLSHAAGVSHPALLTSDHIEILNCERGQTIEEIYGYPEGLTKPSSTIEASLAKISA